MEKNKKGKRNKLNSIYGYISGLNLKTPLATAFIIALATVAVNALVDLLRYVYWYSFFRRYQVPLKYIKDAASFNSNVKIYILLLVPLIGTIINLYGLIKKGLSWLFSRYILKHLSALKHSLQWLLTLQKKLRNGLCSYVIKFVFIELLLLLLFLITLAGVDDLSYIFARIIKFPVDDNNLFILIVASLIYCLIRKDAVRQLYLRRKIKKLLFKSKLNIVMFLFTTGFLFTIMIVVLYGSVAHNVYSNGALNPSTKLFIDPGFADGERDETQETSSKKRYHGTVDLILFESNDYFYTIKAEIGPDSYGEKNVHLYSNETSTYSLQKKQDVSVKKCIVFDYTDPKAKPGKDNMIFIISLFYVLFAISAICNFGDCLINA